MKTITLVQFKIIQGITFYCDNGQSWIQRDNEHKEAYDVWRLAQSTGVSISILK